jgi:hypothetical protein
LLTKIFLRANDDRFLRCLNVDVFGVCNGVISLLAVLKFVWVAVPVVLLSITDVIALSDDDLDEFDNWRLAIVLREMAEHLSR